MCFDSSTPVGRKIAKLEEEVRELKRRIQCLEATCNALIENRIPCD